MARHPDISERLTQNLTNCRSDLTEDRIRNWFQEINDYLVADHLQAAVKHLQRIYYADGTAFFLVPKGTKCLIRKGDKTGYSFIGNAHIVNMMPKKWAIDKSESGWMTSHTFFEYVANIFSPWLSENEIPRPVLFFVDEHALHLTMDLSNFCTENQIILVALYPNATHVLEPITCGLFPFDPNAINYAKYFKDDKNKSNAVNTKPNLEFKVKKRISRIFESQIGNEKLSNFKHKEEADDWSGEVKDTNLFML
ncbi:hypothetical protein ILUMI_14969 [Ignelater luminosus]|uniref:DDE-1 domain-containing protein n=1 Tax=Ignelater luminosus TaxID=2038154 RepID=A0A8K0CPI4_IGNLU|nr:hypothetical protein ILUMI_14969 [Ignelater luminosus]